MEGRGTQYQMAQAGRILLPSMYMNILVHAHRRQHSPAHLWTQSLQCIHMHVHWKNQGQETSHPCSTAQKGIMQYHRMESRCWWSWRALLLSMGRTSGTSHACTLEAAKTSALVMLGDVSSHSMTHSRRSDWPCATEWTYMYNSFLTVLSIWLSRM